MAFNIASYCIPSTGTHAYYPDLDEKILEGWIICWKSRLAKSPEEAERDYISYIARKLSEGGPYKSVFAKILQSGRMPVKRACRCEVI